MKTTKTKFLLGLLAIMLLAVGCKKEKTENITTTPQTSASGILQFDSAEEFLETQQKVLAMSETERREWERQQGFKSYATKCYELLENFEAQGIHSNQDVYNFVKENSEYYYIQDENGEKSVKCHLCYSPYFYLVNEDKLLLQTENLCIKAFDEGVVYCSIEYMDQIKQINSFSERSFSDNMSYVQLNNKIQNSTQLTQNSTKNDIIDILGNNTAYKGLCATRKDWREGNRNIIELIVMEAYFAQPGQYITDLLIHNYPEHRIAGLWFPCQRRKNFTVTVTWETRVYANYVKQTDSFNAVDDGGYYTNRVLESIPIRIEGYKFDLFKGNAYTYDTPRMMNFNSSQTNFGL